MEDPDYGFFRLWSIHELAKSNDIKIGDLIVDPDTQAYYEIESINPLHYTPWFLSNDSQSDSVSVDGELINNFTPWESYRLGVDHLLQTFTSWTVDDSNAQIDHIRIYSDPDLRSVVSRIDVGDVSGDLEDTVRLNNEVYSGDTLYYTFWGPDASLLAIIPLITYLTESNIIDDVEAPIDVRLVTPLINPSDPRVIDLRGVEYQDVDDFQVMSTAPSGDVEVVRVDGIVNTLEGLVEAYYGEVKFANVGLRHYRDITGLRYLTKSYRAYFDEVELPYIEPLPDPVLEEVYSTSDPYPVVLDNEDVIVDTPEVTGRAISREVLFSTSVLYPYTNSNDPMSVITPSIGNNVGFLEQPIVSINRTMLPEVADVVLRSLRKLHINPNDGGITATAVINNPTVGLRNLRKLHANPNDGGINIVSATIGNTVSLRAARVYHTNPNDAAITRTSVEVQANVILE